jgi:dipeptidyl aminopeptidase/acylaminoacyl peptidase
VLLCFNVSMFTFRSVASWLAIVCAAYAQSAPGKEPILPSDLLRIEQVTEIEIAPDSSFAVYAVRSIHTEPGKDSGDATYSYRTHLWTIDLNAPNAKPVELTFGDRRDGDFTISPDGSELAFVRTDTTQTKPHPQVWVLPLRSAGEARQATHLEYGATSPRWWPDGRALLVTSAIPISKLPGMPPFDMGRPAREWKDVPQEAKEDKPGEGKAGKPPLSPDSDLSGIRRWLEYNADKNNPVDITRMAFLDEATLAGEMEISELFRVDLQDEAAPAKQLTQSFYPHNNAALSPDGTKILFNSRPRSSQHPDFVRNKSAIWQVDADGSNEHTLIESDRFNFFGPKLTADGKHILVLGAESDQPSYRQTALAECDADGRNLIWLTDQDAPSVAGFRVTDDDNVYFERAFHGGVRLERLNLGDRKIAVLVEGPVGVGQAAPASKRAVYSLISVPDPNELFVLETSSGATRQLTALNSEWLKNKELSLPEEHWITRPDGQKVEYWVMKPSHPEAGKMYPWVLDMHGGPSAMWGPGELSMWHEFQLFCSFGYGVVYANPRGSSGYGYAFQHGNYKDWGDGPTGDVLAALDDAEAHETSMDRDRLFLTGGSYAGYLTAWIIGHDHRFKAAAAQRGVYDLATFFGEGNAYSLVPEEFGGYPWQKETRKLLDEESPLTYAPDITTPFLIIHGSSDLRTGFVQSQMLFRALRAMGKPVEYIRYPGATHELTRSGEPRQRIDHMLRIVEFFERYAKNDRPAPQAAAGK